MADGNGGEVLVSPTALREYAAAAQAEAVALTRISESVASAVVHDAAFGDLAASRELHSAYQRRQSAGAEEVHLEASSATELAELTDRAGVAFDERDATMADQFQVLLTRLDVEIRNGR